MFARTDRLLLRPGWVEDAPALAAAIGDPAILRNLATAPCPYRVEDAQAFLATERRTDEPTLLIFRRTAGAPQLAGGIGIGLRPDGAREFGYWIARPFWGLGYATEAGTALLAAARDTLRFGPIEAGHFLDNPASGRVLQKLGFRWTGEILPRISVGRGEAVPCKVFTIDLQRRARTKRPDPAPQHQAALAA